MNSFFSRLKDFILGLFTGFPATRGALTIPVPPVAAVPQNNNNAAPVPRPEARRQRSFLEIMGSMGPGHGGLVMPLAVANHYAGFNPPVNFRAAPTRQDNSHAVIAVEIASAAAVAPTPKMS